MKQIFLFHWKEVIHLTRSKTINRESFYTVCWFWISSHWQSVSDLKFYNSNEKEKKSST